MKNKYLPGLLVVVCLVGPMTTRATMAQDNTSSSGGDSTAGATRESRDNGSDWGWLGLLGLAGLAGLRRPEPTVVHHNQEAATRSH